MTSTIARSLYDGRLIRLGPILDYDKDSAVESGWTHDASFMRMLYFDPMRPLSPAQVKKKYEEMEKEADERRTLFPFRVRALEDDRLLGLAEIFRISWSNANAGIRMGIGLETDRRQGYGRDALGLLLRYAFDELNLYRLTAPIGEYNLAARALFGGFGFVEEVRRREALNRDGRRWDLIHYGLLAEEWRAASKGE